MIKEFSYSIVPDVPTFINDIEEDVYRPGQKRAVTDKWENILCVNISFGKEVKFRDWFRISFISRIRFAEHVLRSYVSVIPWKSQLFRPLRRYGVKRGIQRKKIIHLCFTKKLQRLPKSS